METKPLTSNEYMKNGVERFLSERNFTMKAHPMSDQDIRELSCDKHEGKPSADTDGETIHIHCRYCNKLMKTVVDPVYHSYLAHRASLLNIK